MNARRLSPTTTKPGLFRTQLRDFWQFVRRPRLAPRLPARVAGSGLLADWLSLPPGWSMLRWVALLWVLNLVVLGPIAVAAASAAGAEHRLDLQAIPWLQALLWAPIVEELVFRYALRSFSHVLWLLPIAVVALLAGPTSSAQFGVIVLLLCCWAPLFAPRWRLTPQQVFRWAGSLRAYRQFFPWVMHGSCIAFAAIHLHNFDLLSTQWWILPWLVLPQWATGLVLAWVRVRVGIGAAMLMHGAFNAGPLFLVWLFVTLAPEIAF